MEGTSKPDDCLCPCRARQEDSGERGREEGENEGAEDLLQALREEVGRERRLGAMYRDSCQEWLSLVAEVEQKLELLDDASESTDWKARYDSQRAYNKALEEALPRLRRRRDQRQREMAAMTSEDLSRAAVLMQRWKLDNLKAEKRHLKDEASLQEAKLDSLWRDTRRLHAVCRQCLMELSFLDHSYRPPRHLSRGLLHGLPQPLPPQHRPRHLPPLPPRRRGHRPSTSAPSSPPKPGQEGEVIPFIARIISPSSGFSDLTSSPTTSSSRDGMTGQDDFPPPLRASASRYQVAVQDFSTVPTLAEYWVAGQDDFPSSLRASASRSALDFSTVPTPAEYGVTEQETFLTWGGIITPESVTPGLTPTPVSSPLQQWTTPDEGFEMTTKSSEYTSGLTSDLEVSSCAIPGPIKLPSSLASFSEVSHCSLGNRDAKFRDQQRPSPSISSGGPSFSSASAAFDVIGKHAAPVVNGKVPTHDVSMEEEDAIPPPDQSGMDARRGVTLSLLRCCLQALGVPDVDVALTESTGSVQPHKVKSEMDLSLETLTEHPETPPSTPITVVALWKPRALTPLSAPSSSPCNVSIRHPSPHILSQPVLFSRSPAIPLPPPPPIPLPPPSNLSLPVVPRDPNQVVVLSSPPIPLPLPHAPLGSPETRPASQDRDQGPASHQTGRGRHRTRHGSSPPFPYRLPPDFWQMFRPCTCPPSYRTPPPPPSSPETPSTPSRQSATPPSPYSYSSTVTPLPFSQTPPPAAASFPQVHPPHPPTPEFTSTYPSSQGAHPVFSVLQHPHQPSTAPPSPPPPPCCSQTPPPQQPPGGRSDSALFVYVPFVMAQPICSYCPVPSISPVPTIPPAPQPTPIVLPPPPTSSTVSACCGLCPRRPSPIPSMTPSVSQTAPDTLSAPRRSALRRSSHSACHSETECREDKRERVPSRALSSSDLTGWSPTPSSSKRSRTERRVHLSTEVSRTSTYGFMASSSGEASDSVRSMRGSSPSTHSSPSVSPRVSSSSGAVGRPKATMSCKIHPGKDCDYGHCRTDLWVASHVLCQPKEADTTELETRAVCTSTALDQSTTEGALEEHQAVEVVEEGRQEENAEREARAQEEEDEEEEGLPYVLEIAGHMGAQPAGDAGMGPVQWDPFGLDGEGEEEDWEDVLEEEGEGEEEESVDDEQEGEDEVEDEEGEEGEGPDNPPLRRNRRRPR